MCKNKNVLSYVDNPKYNNIHSNNFFCKVCNQNFKNLDNYFNHLKTAHFKKNNNYNIKNNII